MAVTPQRLAGPAYLAATPTTLYTAPAQTRTVLRHIHVHNTENAKLAVRLSIGADGASTRILEGELGPDGEMERFVYYVLETGQFIQGAAGRASRVVVVLDGDQHT